MKSSANRRQVGGSHYKIGGEEHWDRMWRLHGAGYFVGCITKYVERYHVKNGTEDLEKAKHFLEKLIELENADAEPRGVGYVDQDREGSLESFGVVSPPTPLAPSSRRS